MGLAKWALKATLPPGGVCLDPFMGTGTTGLATLQAGGRFLGIDVRADFVSHFVKWTTGNVKRPKRTKSRGSEAPSLFECDALITGR